jgi:hypothetical protein
MTKPILDTKQYLFTKEGVTVYLEIDCQRKIYSVGIKDADMQNSFTATDNFSANITAASLILDAVTFAKDEMQPEYTVE